MTDYQSNIISKKLFVFRSLQGLSQDDIAKKMGIARPTYGLVEQGKQTPTSYFISKICKAFPDEDFSWLTGTSMVSEPRSSYGDTLESRLSRVEEKLDILMRQNKQLLELYGNIATYINKLKDR